MVRSLFVLLILAGVGVGVLWSMELKGRQRRAGLAADNRALQTRLAFAEAKNGEMLAFLARPQTELVKLTGAREWTGQAMNVAWNPVQRMAVVLMDRLPAVEAGMAYRLRVLTDGGAVSLGELDVAGPARRAYAVPQSAGERVRFDVVVGDGREGRVVFEMVKT
jgi:hypothetical protein